MSNRYTIQVSGSQLFNQVFNSVTQRPVWPIRVFDTPASDDQFSIQANPAPEDARLETVAIPFEVVIHPTSGEVRTANPRVLRYQSTQRPNTVPSYIKATSILQRELAGKDLSELVLVDFGAGLCRGTAVLEERFPDSMVVAYEPFPDYKNPWFVNPTNLYTYSFDTRPVDAIVCLNVLNVLDRYFRAAVLKDVLGKTITRSGIAVIGVRSKSDVAPLVEKHTAAAIDPNCAVIPKRINGIDVKVLQTGFTFESLETEILDAADYLGVDVSVERIEGLCGVGALVRHLD